MPKTIQLIMLCFFLALAAALISYLVTLQRAVDTLTHAVNHSNPITPHDMYDSARYVVYLKIYGTLSEVDENGNHFVVEAAGSGFVIAHDNQCYILSAHHIATGMIAKSSAAIFDPRLHLPPQPITLIGWSEIFDVALWKFADSTFRFDAYAQPAVLGSSQNLEPGDTVLALGAPYHIPFTLSTGTVMNTKLGVREHYDQPQMIMHQCPINPGSSGGPLIALNTKTVIGMNIEAYRASRSPFCTPMPIAVPTDDIRSFLPKLTRGGKIIHAQLTGVKFNDSTLLPEHELPCIRGLYGYHGINRPPCGGVFVTDIEKNSDAEKNGLRIGDGIRTINDSPIATTNELIRLIIHSDPTSLVHMNVLRDDTIHTVTIPLEQLTEHSEDH